MSSRAAVDRALRAAVSASVRPCDSATNGTAMDGRDHAERHVDEEDPAPVQVLADQAADDRAERQAERPDRPPDADRGRPLAGVGERRGDDREARGHHQRRAEALHRPRRDQHVGAAGQARRQRGEREDDQAGQEHPASAEDVRDPAADQQQAAEHEQVAAHDPLKPADRQVQAALDRRERDVDHVVIEIAHRVARLTAVSAHHRVLAVMAAVLPLGACTKYLYAVPV